ncbi:arylsulfatase [Lecanosticta acicola]|uniref:Arylsulfatase n=1 Tax=Lecanosticta acicola TaxID=111012 RepID=A0AAI8YRI4_9PEZI|nr:arylsulfatase [Lecanosticta acicola]
MLISALWTLASMTAAAAAKPNVVVIMPDDQDKHLDSLSVMPHVSSLIGDQGVRYDSHYCTIAWCCPSRVNLLTGKAAHNTNVTTLTMPYGGYGKFIKEGHNSNYLPLWIQASGAKTYYVGKFMNAYQRHNWHAPYPKGWTNSSFLVDPWTYNYWNSTWTNGDARKHLTAFPGHHTTHVTRRKALEFIDQAVDAGGQFFMMVAPVAPHAYNRHGGDRQLMPPAPPEFVGAFNNSIAPRSPNFNPDEPSGASWILHIPKQHPKRIAHNDNFHRHRLRNLAGVDLMVQAIVQKLQDRAVLDNTYIIFTSDNGFHIGNHRLSPGKRCGFEEDINIPLLIRGPNMPQNITSAITNSHTDIAPTILSMMDIPLRNDFDGSPIALREPDLSSSDKNEHLGVEFWDSPKRKHGKLPHDENGANKYYNNTYKSLRIKSGGQSFYYSVWCTGEKEFYDMNADPYQMDNLHRTLTGPMQNLQFFDRPWHQLVPRLDALLMVLKSCKQDTCRDPYSVLFPKREVRNLTAAMHRHYDNFFDGTPKLKFHSCHTGYIPHLEQESRVLKPYGAGSKRGLDVFGFIFLMVGWGLYWVLQF